MSNQALETLRSAITPTSTTVTTTATLIPATATSSRQSIMIKNNGSNIVYLGDSTVTINNGYPLAVNAEVAINLDEKLVIYGITEADTSDVRTLEGA